MCGPVIQLSSAQPLDFLDLVKNCLFLNWTLANALFSFMDGHNSIIAESQKVSSGWQTIKRQRFWLPDFKGPYKLQFPNPLFDVVSV